ncbi:hypothetical protein PEQA60_22190 [Pseudomonas sp. Eqa60]|uniref:phage portal protein n=1 Tax=Pseudomonas sp. Eqa60 TaxID=2799184 RepID=UPI001BF18499|nr:anti-CBASS Acb1 family protein [Pseudomonas sp. Eqa60]BCQ68229.1 hypothetical protein PEQA60_22190 [Pseudomonas sp. Eqa60]
MSKKGLVPADKKLGKALVRAAQKFEAQIKSSSDGLVNVVSGLGTQKAKRSHNQFQYGFLNDFQQLDAAYQTSWLARAIVDYPAEDMTREWRTLKCDDADVIRAEEDRLQLPAMVSEATSWARLYGGAGILMLTNQDLTKPLRPEKIKKGDLYRLLVIDRFDMTAMDLNQTNILAANYLQPEFYTIAAGAQMIHWTHFARFAGAKLPRRQRAQTQGWGDSELRKCLDDVMDMVASKDGIAELMQEANVDIIKRVGLSDELASDQDDVITKRYALFSMMKSSINLALLDGEETYDRKTLDLSGVAPVLDLLMTWIAGAAGIPVTRLFGESAKGLGNDGQGDDTNYYNHLSSKRLTQIDPGLRQLDEVMVRSATGRWLDDFNYVWNPYKQPDAVQISAANKAKAETDLLYKDGGIVTTSQIQRRLQAEELYQFDDDKIAALEADEDLTMFNDPVDDEPDADKKSTSDAAPAPLYVFRPVLNADDLINWAKSQGFTQTLPADDLHVTVAFSKSPVDWMKAGEAYSSRDDGGVTVRPGGPRMLEVFGEGAVVLAFNSSDLSWRHMSLREIGASWDYPEYQPHITITYNLGDVDVSKVEPYRGEIILGAEVFKPIKQNWKADVSEE